MVLRGGGETAAGGRGCEWWWFARRSGSGKSSGGGERVTRSGLYVSECVCVCRTSGLMTGARVMRGRRGVRKRERYSGEIAAPH